MQFWIFYSQNNQDKTSFQHQDTALNVIIGNPFKFGSRLLMYPMCFRKGTDKFELISTNSSENSLSPIDETTNVFFVSEYRFYNEALYSLFLFD
jgi:hypothetical protein